MGKVSLNELAGDPGLLRRTVRRSDRMEVTRVFYPAGATTEEHSHPEEQSVYVERGRLRVTLGEGEAADTYVVEAGQGSFHGGGVAHRMEALEDTVAVSFKNLVDGGSAAGAGRLQ